ncbi:MAG: hypothetical protein JWN98_2450 [Abditibacteriota bacterium]|nr:hypothetical protein [Abditibacteriota bacterium]
MTFPLFHYQAEHEPPFTIFIEHRDKSQGHWRPAAFVRLTASLRTSGFLLALPPDEMKTFLLLLTFVTPNGDCRPTVSQLATALRLSEAKTRVRLERLLEVRWQEQPIVLPHHPGNCLKAFTLMPGLLPVQEEKGTAAPPAPLYRAAPREAVIEHSRRTYGRPRAEVERQIEEQMGYKRPPETASDTVAGMPAPAEDSHDPKARLRRDLLAVGLLPQQADELITHYDEVRIRRQLMWLPHRFVRNRAGFLLAAIKDDYAAPAAARSRPPQATDPKDSSPATSASHEA